MKKLLFVTAILCIVGSTKTFAQDGEGAAYSKGQSTVSLGYGFGNIWKKLFKITAAFSGGTQKVSATGPYSLTYEYGISEKISVGLALGYSQVKSVSTNTSPNYSDIYTEKLTNISAVARGNYHFGSSAKFDPYVGLGLGYYNFKYTAEDVENDNGTITTTKGNNLFAIPGAFGFSAQLGAKYYFSSSVGAFAEVGYVAGSIAQVGITFKF